jgi:hypothetical protein
MISVATLHMVDFGVKNPLVLFWTLPPDGGITYRSGQVCQGGPIAKSNKAAVVFAILGDKAAKSSK